MKQAIVAIAALCCAAPALAQLGQLKKGLEKAQKLQDLQISEQEERDLGASLSERIRTAYGVVQDPAVQKYVALVGTVLAQASTRPGLEWKFIVLDTDAVNAFAAPGGYVHITRGALGLIKTEAQLAGVLGHEITHVTNKHTLEAIQKNKLVQAGANETLAGNQELLKKVVDQSYNLIIENKFDRGDEAEADRNGVALANKLGYAPAGLAEFLGGLLERNKGQTTSHGLFASHPETQERIDRIKSQIAADKLTATATVEPRYRKNISYTAKPQGEIAMVDPGVRGVAGGGTAKDGDKDKKESDDKDKSKEKKKGFGLGSLTRPLAPEKQSAQVTSSGGSRGVGDPDRNAKGGDNPAIVVVRLTPADIAEFKKGIS